MSEAVNNYQIHMIQLGTPLHARCQCLVRSDLITSKSYSYTRTIQRVPYCIYPYCTYPYLYIVSVRVSDLITE